MVHIPVPSANRFLSTAIVQLRASSVPPDRPRLRLPHDPSAGAGPRVSQSRESLRTCRRLEVQMRCAWKPRFNSQRTELENSSTRARLFLLAATITMEEFARLKETTQKLTVRNFSKRGP